MYSNNDYRYYLEHRMQESDDFLMHYGVKGMRWRQHKSPAEYQRQAEMHEQNARLYGDKVRSYTQQTGPFKKPTKADRPYARMAVQEAVSGKINRLNSAASTVRENKKKKRKERIRNMFRRVDTSGMKKIGKNLYLG